MTRHSTRAVGVLLLAALGIVLSGGRSRARGA